MGIGPSCPRGENALLQPTPQYDDIAGWESRICSSRSLPPTATASQLRPEAICAVQLPFVAFMASILYPPFSERRYLPVVLSQKKLITTNTAQNSELTKLFATAFRTGG
jgi:hypothetical protein